MSQKRVVFIGTEEIGWRCLDALIGMDVRVVGVFTLLEERARQAVAFRSFASFEARSVPLHFIDDVNSVGVVDRIRGLKPDVIYQIGWSQLLSSHVLGLPTEACVGMHCSLLPKHRGRAPIPWSIMLGLRRSGMSLFYLTEAADAGDVIGQQAFDILLDDSATEVYEKAAEASVQLIRNFHPQLEAGTAPRVPQDATRSDRWPRRRPEDGLIDWDRSAGHLWDWVRALTHPFPGAFTFWRNERLIVWRARPSLEDVDVRAGEVVAVDRERGILVSTGEGGLWLTSVQWSGDEERAANEFAAHHGLVVGESLA